MLKCAATNKLGEPCGSWAIKGREFCRFHGGNVPVGFASPKFKTGKYSKFLPDRLLEKYQVALKLKDPLKMMEEVALLDARLVEMVERIPTDEDRANWRRARTGLALLKTAIAVSDGKKIDEAVVMLDTAITAGVGEARAWDDVVEAIENKRRLVESERRRMVEMGEVLPIDKVILLMTAVADIVRRNVTEQRIVARIANELNAILEGSYGTDRKPATDSPDTIVISASSEDGIGAETVDSRLLGSQGS